MTGTLYLVSTPMGNWDELSPRAVQILKDVDILVCEEWKTGRTLMRRIGLIRSDADSADQKSHPVKPELLRMNEHDRAESTAELFTKLASGLTIALFSDSGAPVFADPGAELVRLCHQANINVKHVSGASSLISALVVCGFSIEPFLFLGWLPRKPEERNAALAKLKQENATAIVMETPYRLMALLESVKQTLGANRLIAVCCNLTGENEHVQRGTVADVIKYFEKHPEKPEFVLVIGGLREKL
jgi:16S rRNA (cytidine1402-2'-O)-methyltransferase